MMFMRPRYSEGNRLLGFAVTTTDGELLQDSQVVEHFPLDTSGKEMREYASEFQPGATLIWGNVLTVEGAAPYQRPSPVPRSRKSFT